MSQYNSLERRKGGVCVLLSDGCCSKLSQTQMSDGSCICQAGYKSYDDDESSSEEDCQPQVALGPQWGRQREGSTIHTVSLPSRVGMTSCVSGKHLGSLPVIKPQGLSFAKGLGSLPCGG